MGGVGIIVDNEIVHFLAEVQPVNQRIMNAFFNDNPCVALIVNYGQGSEEVQGHFETNTNVIHDILKH